MSIRIKAIAAAVCAAIAFAALSGAAPANAAPAAAKTKLIVIRTCPITGEKVVGDPAGFEIVGNYKVYFCCGGCQPEFDKETKAQKLAQLAKLAKAQK